MTPNQQRVGLGILTVAFVAAAVAWTVASAASLSHTFDEPHHLATPRACQAAEAARPRRSRPGTIASSTVT
jgi:hypothetical protein